ncbi:hypothetical protein [Rhizobium sp. BK376]|uniref:hypothetical protein n=1 Tax=Rhizobium sp. BK376 TaxID=2512149 RepID=UPI001049B37A|nr:hypothetical protein [Rhizobium sp. BK376]TCR80796.1 hypothetical protein EV561_11373 [Rhizobium sp. BK376]
MTFMTSATIFTAACGIAAVAVAVLPLAFPAASDNPMLAELFRTFLYLFAGGVGALTIKAFA